MDAKSWIFSIFTGLVLTVVALIHAFFLMWGMENYRVSVKPYAYALFGVLSLIIIAAAAVFAGPLSSWAARKMFSGSETARYVLCIVASVLAIIIGTAALFITMPSVLAIFDDPLPRAAGAMRVDLPDNTQAVFSEDRSWKSKLIVKLDADGWEKFRRSELFQTQPLKISPADKTESPRDWQTFETNKNAAQSYRWANNGEPNLLQVLARSGGDGQIYVYLYRRNGPAAQDEE